MRLLRRFDEFLNAVEGGALIALLTLMVLLAFLQVVLRNVFNAGILWADILLRHLVLWIGFLGAGLAASRHRHINIDALTRFLPERLRAATNILTDLFAATICYFLFRASLTFISNEIEAQTTVFEDIPAWYAQIIIPVGFGLLIIHFVIRALLSVQAALGKEQAA